MTDSKPSEKLRGEDAIAPHIFSASVAMVGVSFTVIGILNVASAFKKVSTRADDLTALDAVGFLLACFVSYFALKSQNPKRRYVLERVADGVFLASLVLMVFVCVFIVRLFS